MTTPTVGRLEPCRARLRDHADCHFCHGTGEMRVLDEPTERPINADAQAWIDAALADGWTLHPGPWARDGRPALDRSVILKRDDLVVWHVDRDTAVGMRPPFIHETWSAGWAMNGHHAIDVPAVYDSAVMATKPGECTECKRTGDPARLKPISFAGRVCPDCDTRELRAKMEPPGWAN